MFVWPKDDSSNVLETYTYGAGRNKLMVETSSERRYFAWGGQSVVAEFVEIGSSTTPAYDKAYIYAGSRLLMTYTPTSTGKEAKEYHHPDRLGTQLVTTGASSSFRQTTFPFGTTIGAETTGNTNHVFTSYDRSATTGLDYAVNRTYSKGKGRFTQVDPIAMASASIGNPQSNNLYAYTQNMPTDFVDPSGLSDEPPIPMGTTWGKRWDWGSLYDSFLRFWLFRMSGGGNGGGVEAFGGGEGGGPLGSSIDRAKLLLQYGPCASLIGKRPGALLDRLVRKKRLQLVSAIPNTRHPNGNLIRGRQFRNDEIAITRQMTSRGRIIPGAGTIYINANIFNSQNINYNAHAIIHELMHFVHNELGYWGSADYENGHQKGFRDAISVRCFYGNPEFNDLEYRMPFVPTSA